MNIKLKRTALIIINQYFGTISEVLCDTEDWRKGR